MLQVVRAVALKGQGVLGAGADQSTVKVLGRVFARNVNFIRMDVQHIFPKNIERARAIEIQGIGAFAIDDEVGGGGRDVRDCLFIAVDDRVYLSGSVTP